MSRAIILDGKALADKILLEIRNEITSTGKQPGLAGIIVGDDMSSQIYLRLKEKAADQVGINFSKYLCNSQCYSDIDERELTELIEFLNHDPAIDGILLQLPLPEGFNADKIIKLISRKKDADGFNGDKVVPPTVAAIIELLKATGENLTDKKTLVIGKSDVFTQGVERYLKKYFQPEADSPLAKKISIRHQIPADSNQYDIIIIALGQAKILKKSQVKSGAIVIDVGINKIKDKTVGDADPSVAEAAGYLSPVPGGVGPLTVACLMRNVLELSKK